jgi:hypothetical protein
VVLLISERNSRELSIATAACVLSATDRLVLAVNSSPTVLFSTWITPMVRPM